MEYRNYLRLVQGVKGAIAVAFIVIALSVKTAAAVELVSAEVVDQRVPVGQPVHVMSVVVKSSDATSFTLTKMTLQAAGNFDFGYEAYRSVAVYYDADNNDDFSDTNDVLLGESNMIDTQGLQDISLTRSTLQIEDNTQYRLFVVVELNPEKTQLLGQTSTLTLTKVRASDNSEALINQANTLTATGIAVTVVDRAPDIVFPGQEDFEVIYFTMEAKGEDADNVIATLTDARQQFVDKGATDNKAGIYTVSLYQSQKTGNDLDTYVTFNITDTGLVGTTGAYKIYDSENTGWASRSEVNLDAADEGGIGFIDLVQGQRVGFWVVYSMGRDVNVNANSEIKVSISKIVATGKSSKKIMQGVTQNTVVDMKLAGAGVFIDKHTDASDTFVYAANNTIPMLAFRMRSYQTAVSVNAISVINSGSVPFYTDTLIGDARNIKEVRVYKDTGNETFSSVADQLVGVLTCEEAAGNSRQRATVTLNQQSVHIAPYDSNKTYREGSNEVLFFVDYVMGGLIDDQDAPSGNTVMAAVGDVVVQGSYVVDNIPQTTAFKASGSRDATPLATTPTSQVTVQATQAGLIKFNGIRFKGTQHILVVYDIGRVFNQSYAAAEVVGIRGTGVTLQDSSSLATLPAYPGQKNVPMIDLQLQTQDSTEAIGSIDVRVWKASFTGAGDAAGVTRVSLILDQNNNNVVDTGDIFLASAIALPTGEDDTEGDQVSGAFPVPNPEATVEIATALDIPVSLSVLAYSNTDPFTAQITVENKSAETVRLTAAQLAFYLNNTGEGIGGADISYEFNVVNQDQYPISLVPGETKVLTFTVTHVNQYSQGEVYLDAAVTYSLDAGSTRDIVLERYYAGGWQAAAPGASSFTVVRDATAADVPPAYLNYPIQLSNVLNGGVSAYLKGGYIPSESEFQLTFKNPQGIDVQSLAVRRGSSILNLSATSETEPGETEFTFEIATGILRFLSGTESADVVLTVNDTVGNAMPATMISYKIEGGSIAVDTPPLFYPSPYKLGSTEPLKLGFSLSKDAQEIQLYIYNHLGVLLFEKDYGPMNAGFNRVEFLDSDSFMVPGIYLGRVIVKDSDGNKSTQLTKVAIH